MITWYSREISSFESTKQQPPPDQKFQCILLTQFEKCTLTKAEIDFCIILSWHVRFTLSKKNMPFELQSPVCRWRWNRANDLFWMIKTLSEIAYFVCRKYLLCDCDNIRMIFLEQREEQFLLHAHQHMRPLLTHRRHIRYIRNAQIDKCKRDDILWENRLPLSKVPWDECQYSPSRKRTKTNSLCQFLFSEPVWSSISYTFRLLFDIAKLWVAL